MKLEKRVHRGYLEWQRSFGEAQEFPRLFGKWQYFYSSEKGEISLIQLKQYTIMGEDQWEILSLEGELFEDVERFDTKREAMRRIKELLN